MTNDSEQDRAPGTITGLRDALGSLRSSWFGRTRDRELELEQMRQRLLDQEAQIGALVAARSHLENQVQTMRTRDPATGLPNRSAFAEALRRRLDPGDEDLWIAIVRLWQFDQLRDSLGESAVTDLMRQIASRITRALGPNVELSRLGDREFGLLLPKRVDRASGTANRLLSIVEDRLSVGDRGVYVQAVVGLAVAEKGTSNAAESIDKAGLAADDAIAEGEKWIAFRDEHQEEIVSRLQLEADLQRAVRNEEFVLHFQPVVNVAENSIAGFEALLRWAHPSGSLILPDRFIPVAEANGMMASISDWVFRAVIAQIEAWRDILGSAVYVSMNLTPRDLNPEFCARIIRMIESAGIEPEQVGVEITETAVIRDFRLAARLIRKISDRGVRVLLDDFGTGYSSMSYLRELPFDCVKIDQSFIHRMAVESRDFGLVRSIVSLVQYLEMECVAEGIETREQLDLISMIDCNYWQGNLFSQAVPAGRIEELLRQGSASVRTPMAG